MSDRLLRKLRARDVISDQEERAILDAIGEVRDYPAGHVLVPAGRDVTFSTLLLDGILARQKELRGGERQITELHVPGDFADLHTFTLKRLDHDVVAQTRCRIAIVPHDKLKAITETQPHLTRVLWFLTNLDAAIHREWEVSLGRRSAISRLACLLCELNVRLKLVGLSDGMSYALGLTQTTLAECLGLTQVHINRTLKTLREEGVVTVRGGRVTIGDLARLEQIAEFDPAYLYLQPSTR